ncbi:MAG: protein translocase subunit SecF [Atribacterota bacterium]
MLEFIRNTHIDFIGFRKTAYTISIIFTIIAVIGFMRGMTYGVDFSGGTLIQYRFGKEVPIEDIRAALKQFNLQESVIQRFSPEEVSIRTIKLNEEQKTALDKAMKDSFGDVKTVRVEDVGPAVGGELRRGAFIALIIAVLGILIYMGLRFEFRPAATSCLALAHDGLIILGLIAIAGREFNTSVLAAILTILGYSINDSIVIMDRIREKLAMRKKEDMKTLINNSLNETLSRTVNTVLTTLLPVVALLFFGGKMTQDFALTMLIGLIFGTYSSIFIAASLFYDWEMRKPLRR